MQGKVDFPKLTQSVSFCFEPTEKKAKVNQNAPTLHILFTDSGAIIIKSNLICYRRKLKPIGVAGQRWVTEGDKVRGRDRKRQTIAIYLIYRGFRFFLI